MPTATTALEIKSQWNHLSALAWRASLAKSGNVPESVADRDRDVRTWLIFIAIIGVIVIREVVYILLAIKVSNGTTTEMNGFLIGNRPKE
jgi:hypothetical protein